MKKSWNSGYKKLDAKAYERRTVEPWHLACVSGQWYLLGHDWARKARRVFVLARMQKVSETDRKFSNPKPAGAEIQRLFQNSFQIWQSENTDLEQIVLRFSGRAAQLVRERNWHSSQQIQELADGNLELSLTLNSLEEIVPWILSWGKDCEVVSPMNSRERSGPLLHDKSLLGFELGPGGIEAAHCSSASSSGSSSIANC